MEDEEVKVIPVEASSERFVEQNANGLRVANRGGG